MNVCQNYVHCTQYAILGDRTYIRAVAQVKITRYDEMREKRMSRNINHFENFAPVTPRIRHQNPKPLPLPMKRLVIDTLEIYFD